MKDSEELVTEIRRLMFVFEDLTKLQDKDIQSILKNVETSQWAMALKGASQALQEKIMRNMSSRASEMLKEEMNFLGRVKVADVEAIQQKIVDIVRSLEESGQLARQAPTRKKNSSPNKQSHLSVRLKESCLTVGWVDSSQAHLATINLLLPSPPWGRRAGDEG